MKFYESGDQSKPVIFLFPGTCCLYSSFDHVLEGLHVYFYTVVVSYDGFDPNENTQFHSMEEECEKIEQEIIDHYGGRIKAAYGCSLGGSFVSLLIQRKRIHMDHGIIGSSDMDVPNTKIHVFYATKMGKKYEKRYYTYFKNPDIHRFNMQHEELFCCHPDKWIEEVRNVVIGDVGL